MHQIRAVSLSSYLEVARLTGIDGGSLLREVGISPAALDDSESRLPAMAAIRLLEKSAELSGCDSYGLRMAQCRSFASLGPVSLLLQHLQDLGEAIQCLITFRRNISDALMVAMQSFGDAVSVTFDLVPPYGMPQASDLTLGMGYVALAGATQGRWQPECVHITHDAPVDRVEFERFFRAPLEFGSDFNGFSFSPAALQIRLPLANHTMVTNAKRLLETVSLPTAVAPLSDHVRQSIVLLLPRGKATLKSVAANLDQSDRAVQRHLRAEGQTFGTLLNEARRELSKRYLAGSAQNITEISQSLGYATQGSFSRWFDTEFGMSPSEWRKAQRELLDRPTPFGASSDGISA